MKKQTLSYPKPSNENNFPSKMKHMIREDITRCESVEKDKVEDLVCELKAKYCNFYEGFDNGLQGSDELITIKNRLEVILKQKIPARIIKNPMSINITSNFNNNNTLNIDISFESIRKKIDDMDNISDKEYEEIKEKINELEAIVKSEESKRKKWTRAGTIIKWLADKSVDVGIALLPLILNIK